MKQARIIVGLPLALLTAFAVMSAPLPLLSVSTGLVLSRFGQEAQASPRWSPSALAWSVFGTPRQLSQALPVPSMSSSQNSPMGRN